MVTSRMRGLFWFAAGVGVAAVVGLVHLPGLQARGQSAPQRSPLITEALVDIENATLTINGFDFSAGVPTVTLGMHTLPVLSAGEAGTVTGFPELLPGAYLLAATWPDGAGAVFHLTVGTVGPAGPPGPQGVPGEPGPFLSTGSGGAGVGRPAPAGPTDARTGEGAAPEAVGRDNLAFGRLTLGALTTGADNVAVGSGAMARSTEASFNVALGRGALEHNAAGEHNVAIGAAALMANQGGANVAVGREALGSNATGSGNTAIGSGAGLGNRAGSDNVYIGSPGEDGESGVIRIGTEGVHTRVHLAGEVVGNFVPVYQP